jgi:hypothetical protein
VIERICRDGLGLRPAGEAMREHKIVRLTLHHTAVKLGENANAPGRLRAHQRYHQDSAGWADIAYHLGIDKRGNLYELRDTRFAGDTFTEYDPSGHFLIVAEGDYNTEMPSDVQLEGIARSFAWAAAAFGADVASISGHRDHAGTSCPGEILYGALPDLRARAADLAAGDGVQMRTICGDEATGRVADIEAGRS